MKQAPGDQTAMADMMTQDDIIPAPQKKGLRVRRELDVGSLQDRQTVERLVRVLKELSKNKFFGELLIKYESGHIVYVRKTQSIKLLEQQAG